MTPARYLLAALESAGYAVWVKDGKLMVAPAGKLPDGWRAEVREYRDDLLALAGGRPPPDETDAAVLRQLAGGAWSGGARPREHWGW